MKSETMKLVLIAPALLLTQASFGFGHYSVWKGGSGNWSDADMWDRAPEAGDYIVFSNDSPAVVTMDVDSVSIADLRLAPCVGGEVGRTVTLKGSHALTQGGSYSSLDFVIGEGRTLVIDGPAVTIRRSVLVGTNAVLDVRSGSLYSSNTGAVGIDLRQGGSVNVYGGSLSVAQIDNTVDAGASLSELNICGGEVSLRRQNAFASLNFDYSKVSFTGGRLLLNEGLTSQMAVILPPAGGEFVTLYTRSSTVADFDAANAVYQLGGKMFLTNRVQAVMNIHGGNNQSLVGGGELYVSRLTVGLQGMVATLDLAKLCVGNDIGSSAFNGTVNMLGGIALGCWNDAIVGGGTHRKSKFSVFGPFSVDTLDCFDRTTVHDFSLENDWFELMKATDLAVTGGGDVALNSYSGLPYLGDVSVGAGTKLVMVRPADRILADTLTLGAGALVEVGSNLVSVSAMQSVAPTATIKYSFDGSTFVAGGRYILWESPYGATPPVGNFAFDPALPSGWFVTNANGVAWVSDGNAQPTPTGDTSNYRIWTGLVDGLASTAGNWVDNKALTGSKFIVFDGDLRLNVENDISNLGEVYDVQFRSDAGPYVISGNRMPVKNGDYKTASISSTSPFPQRLETQVAKTTTSNPVAIYTPGGSYIEAVGGGELPDSYLFFQGDVRVGGTWRVATLAPQKPANTSRATRLSVLSGGILKVLDQRWGGTDATTVSNQAFACVYDVHAGATMEVGGSLWRWSAFENTHYVNGAVKATCPVQMAMAQTFRGTGSLDFACVRSDTSSACRMNLAGSVTIRPQEWLTVRTGADNPMRLCVRDTVTIGATADWAYGPAEGFSSASAPADRALLVEGGARTTVSFDTQDPDDASVGHVITLADPLVQTKYSTVVKRGKGELRLPDSGNELSNFDIRGGTLALGAAQAFDNLTFAGGGRIRLAGSLADASAGGKTTILTATKVVGEVAIDGNYKVSVVETNGKVTVQAKWASGMMLIFR